MSKHTPGPWAVKDKTHVYTQNLDMIAVAQHNRQTEANARLISAAPDLLAALHAVLNASGDDETLAAYKAARAAIAKAEDV